MKNLTRKILPIALLTLPFITTAARLKIKTVDELVRVLEKLATNLTIIFFAIAGILLFYAAFLYLTAAGNEENITKAKDMLIYIFIGLVIASVAWSLPKLVENILSTTPSGPSQPPPVYQPPTTLPPGPTEWGQPLPPAG